MHTLPTKLDILETAALLWLLPLKATLPRLQSLVAFLLSFLVGVIGGNSPYNGYWLTPNGLFYILPLGFPGQLSKSFCLWGDVLGSAGVLSVVLSASGP